MNSRFRVRLCLRGRRQKKMIEASSDILSHAGGTGVVVVVSVQIILVNIAGLRPAWAT